MQTIREFSSYVPKDGMTVQVHAQAWVEKAIIDGQEIVTFAGADRNRLVRYDLFLSTFISTVAKQVQGQGIFYDYDDKVLTAAVKKLTLELVHAATQAYLKMKVIQKQLIISCQYGRQIVGDLNEARRGFAKGMDEREFGIIWTKIMNDANRLEETTRGK